jgi:KRAB domain-containing zinc finger protein
VPNSGTLTCDICEKNPQTKLFSILKHYCFALDDKQGNKCTVCGKMFRNTSELQHHSASQHCDVTHYCIACGKHHKTEGGLHTHQQAHWEQYSFICAYCGRTLFYKSEYGCLTSTHTNVTLYQCDTCGMSASHVFNKKQHTRISGFVQQLMQCSVCPSISTVTSISVRIVVKRI